MKSEGHIYRVAKKPCDECSQELTYILKDESYDFSCEHCNCTYRYYPQWAAFGSKRIEVINFASVHSQNADGLDGCENWGVDG